MTPEDAPLGKEFHAAKWQVGDVTVVLVESESETGVHSLVSQKNGEYYCSCKGFRYWGHCWHQDLALGESDCDEEQPQDAPERD